MLRVRFISGKTTRAFDASITLVNGTKLSTKGVVRMRVFRVTNRTGPIPGNRDWIGRNLVDLTLHSIFYFLLFFPQFLINFNKSKKTWMYRNQERGDKIRKKKKNSYKRTRKKRIETWLWLSLDYPSGILEIFDIEARYSFLAVKNSLWWVENTSFKN